MSNATSRPPRRFSIKVARWETPNPIILKDAARPAFLGQYPTIARAARAMDNIVRRERGMPPRIDWEAMASSDGRAMGAAIAEAEDRRTRREFEPEGFSKPASWHEYREHAERYGIEA